MTSASCVAKPSPGPIAADEVFELTPRMEQLHWQLGLSGVSCFCAQGTVHWIETTMVRQQLAHRSELGMIGMAVRIVREEGAAALYRGFSAASLRELSYSSLRFGLYEPIKHSLGARDGQAPFYKKVLAGLSAGAIAAAVASPTDLLKIRMQSETGRARSLLAHTRDIWRDGGARTLGASVGNFYRGVTTTITRASLIGATKMATYDQTKQTLRETMRWRDEVTAERYSLQFVASVTAGLAIVVASSPATNARTMIMAAEHGRYRGMLHCMYDIVKTRGFLGLYRGFLAQWARVGPYAIVQFFVWEQLRTVVGMRPL
ncbi:hypothetical protein CTAYLR_002410 [Chrysophaeum taylorii]|uniref:Uncharacterized protein n=1 Tax=Chrysophaeum taylorii TaxID=2483200 RepID=A0AAD7UG89_9STRA|nr:hypothetical protein CTAYLR_002410 [Chrysophaeum taylorii]